jgi:molybdate transport system substrate-binding protein
MRARHARVTAPLILGAAVVLAAVGCAPAAPAATSTTTGATSSSPSNPVTGNLTVYAAASLQQSYARLGDQLHQLHPGLTVKFVFGGSSDLVSQLKAGAPGDVLATADEKTMQSAKDAGLLAADPVTFASNHLTIVTAPGNPLGIAGLADLTKPGMKLVVCAPQVPCGSATQQVATLAGVQLAPVSEENSVTSVLSKVVSGDADAGLVYTTDAKGAGSKVSSVAFPESDQVTNRYPIAALKSATNPPAATLFLAEVTGAAGQQILQEAGFGPANG